MHVVDFDRYRLRLHLECPLLGAPEHRRHRAFDLYTAELVRDDDTVCAAVEVYFVRIDDARADHARAAAAIGSEFLYPKPPRPVPARGRPPGPPRLRVVGKPRQPN